MYNDVIKAKKIDVEKVVGYPLNEGLNKIELQVTKNTCNLDLSYDIIVPSNQKEETIYAFFLTNTIEVTGRGSKKYNDEIIEEVKAPMDKIEVREDEITYSESLKEKVILSGYKEINYVDKGFVYEAVYTNVLFIPFDKEETVNCTDIHTDTQTFKNSTAENLIRHVIEDTRYNVKEREVRILFNNSIYKFNGVLGEDNSYTYYLTRTTIHRIQDKEESYILDKKNRVWEKVASFNEENEVITSFEDICIVDHSLYMRTSMFSNLYQTDGYKYLLINQQLYRNIPSANIIHLEEEGTPFMETNLTSNTVLFASGLYRTIEWNNEKYLIAPIHSDYISSSYPDEFNLAIFNGTIFSVVGKVSKIGFIQENYGREESYRVSVQPKQDYTNFYENVDELMNAMSPQAKAKLQLEIFDEEFKNKLPLYQLDNKVKVVKELTQHSQLKGLEGIIVSISENKEKVSVQFFNHFVETFTKDYLELV